LSFRQPATNTCIRVPGGTEGSGRPGLKAASFRRAIATAVAKRRGEVPDAEHPVAERRARPVIRGRPRRPPDGWVGSGAAGAGRIERA